jgi:hypothetical protein
VTADTRCPHDGARCVEDAQCLDCPMPYQQHPQWSVPSRPIVPHPDDRRNDTGRCPKCGGDPAVCGVCDMTWGGRSISRSQSGSSRGEEEAGG